MSEKTIIIRHKKTKNKIQKKTSPLENHTNIKTQYIRYFYGCWIKAIHKQTQEYISGGFLTKIIEDIIYLRNIQNEDLLTFDVHEYTFYVKKTSEQYLSMQEIELEKEHIKYNSNKIKNDMKLLKEEKSVFLKNKNNYEIELKNFKKIKNKFFKLFYDGKVKILI